MPARIDPLTRYVVHGSGCWIWTGPIDGKGYGRHGAPLAHRVVYVLLRGKTHCKRGHEFTVENTYTYPNGERECRECARTVHRRTRMTPEYRKREAARMRARRALIREQST